MKKLYTLLVIVICYVLMTAASCKKPYDVNVDGKQVLFEKVMIIKYPILEVNKISNTRLLVSYQLRDNKTDTFDNLTPDLYEIYIKEQIYLPIQPTITVTYDYKEYRDGSYSMDIKKGVKYTIILPENYPMN